MLSSKFENIKNFIHNKKVLVLTHELVDIDALASIASIKYILNELKHPNVYVYHSKLTKATKEFYRLFSEKFKVADLRDNLPEISKIDVIIVLDTNNIDKVAFPDNKGEKALEKKRIIIDHHTDLENKRNENLSIINDSFNSTSEIIYEMFQHYNIQIPMAYTYLIIAAIIVDSGFFKHANKGAFQRLAKLLNGEVDYQDILSLLDHTPDLSEKIAKIKGVQRVKLHQVDGYLIGVTHVSNFRAKVASNLLNLGFDLVIVYSNLKEGYFMTTRAKKYLCLDAGLNLGKILEKINGSGGGHDGAASVFVESNIDENISEILDTIKEVLKGSTKR